MTPEMTPSERERLTEAAKSIRPHWAELSLSEQEHIIKRDWLVKMTISEIDAYFACQKSAKQVGPDFPAPRPNRRAGGLH